MLLVVCRVDGRTPPRKRADPLPLFVYTDDACPSAIKSPAMYVDGSNRVLVCRYLEAIATFSIGKDAQPIEIGPSRQLSPLRRLHIGCLHHRHQKTRSEPGQGTTVLATHPLQH